MPQGEPKVYHNLWQAVRGITAARGVQGLYSGLGVTLIEIMPYAALQFGIYDALQAAWAAARVRPGWQLHGAHISCTARSCDQRMMLVLVSHDL